MSKAKRRPIYLIGPMGVGKSTVGKRLAARLGRHFVDSDEAIEAAAGRSIAELFDERGEAAFREIEAETVDALDDPGSVVALGGGALTHPGTLEKLLERGPLVYLRASVDVLIERIGDPSSRPLLAGLDAQARADKLAALIEARRERYERAPFIVDAEGDADEVAARIEATLAS